MRYIIGGMFVLGSTAIGYGMGDAIQGFGWGTMIAAFALAVAAGEDTIHRG